MDNQREIKSIYDLFLNSARIHPNNIFLFYKNRSLTYSQTLSKIKQLTTLLNNQHLKRNDKVAIVSENKPEWCIAYLTIVANGFTAVPIDPLLDDNIISGLLKDSDSKLVFTSKKRNLDKIKTIILDDYIFNLKESEPDNIVDSNDIASIVYTSGTTSDPKGVMLTHRNLIFDVINGQKIFDCRSNDSLLLLLPLYHVFSFTAIFLLATYTGTKLVFVDSFNKNEIMEAIRLGKVTIMFGVPRLFDMLYKGIVDKLNEQPRSKRILVNALRSASKAARHHLNKNIGKVFFREVHDKIGKTIRLMVSGGAPLSKEVFHGMSALGFTIVEGYGLTETSPVITLNNPKNPRAGSVGKPLPGIEIRIINKKGNIGEVIVKGPIVMKGYYKKPELTDKIIKDNWLYTGDLGYFDNGGYLYLKGRKDNMIVLDSGKNVYPDELEHHYSKSEFISEICVLGIKESNSEKVFALIIPNKGKIKGKGYNIQEIIRSEIIRLSEGLPSYKKISDFKLVDNLLKTSTLKFKKNLIKKDLENGNGDVDMTRKIDTKNIKQAVFSALAQISGKKQINEDDDLELDLAIDSIAVAELMAKLENAGINIENKDNSKISKVKDVLDMITNYSQVKDINFDNEEGIPLRADFSEESRIKRMDWLVGKLNLNLYHLNGKTTNAELLKGNIEHYIGMSQIPTGISGPLLVNGQFAKGNFYVPLATTEGALVASVNRGMKVITESNGANVRVLGEQMTKAPMFVFNNALGALKFRDWAIRNKTNIIKAAESTTRFGKLQKIEEYILGRRIILRICYSCGDAMGANMITVATQRVVDYINSNYKGILQSFLQCNLEGEKKINALNFLTGRGKKVIAEAIIPKEVIKTYLHTTPEKISEIYKASTYGSIASGMIGTNAHISNVLTSIFIATGQDVAHVHDASIGITSIDLLDNGDLYVAVNLNSLPIGTIGGGTGKGTQKECLEILGCFGTNKSNKLAEIIAAAVLAGEISLAGSQAAGDFASMHDKFGRNRPK